MYPCLSGSPSRANVACACSEPKRNFSSPFQTRKFNCTFVLKGLFEFGLFIWIVSKFYMREHLFLFKIHVHDYIINHSIVSELSIV